MYRLWFAALLAASSTFAQEAGERTLRGVVIDTVGTPLPNVQIKPKGKKTVLTDEAGRFSVLVNAKEKVSVDIRRVGLHPTRYVAETVPDTAIMLMMLYMPQVLPKVEVEARRRRALERVGFYDRLNNREHGAGGGYFITPEDLEKRRPGTVTQAAEGVPGVRISPGVGSDSPMFVGRNNCIMNVFLDGIRLTPDSARTRLMRAYYAQSRANVPASQRAIPHEMNVQIDQLISAGSVAAMEIYPRAMQAPHKYQVSTSECGIVLIWMHSYR